MCSFETSTAPSGFRRALAPKALPPGSAVSSEISFVTVLFPAHSHRYCAHCLVPFTEGQQKRCLGGCDFTYYCGRSCQLADFPVHKHTCKKYAKIIGNSMMLYCNDVRSSSCGEDFPLEDFLLARRAYIKLCLLSNIPLKEKCSTVPMPSELQDLSEGSTNYDQRIRLSEQRLASILSTSFNLNGTESDLFFESLLRKFRCNNFGIQNALQTVIGHGVFPKGAILNHSCDPNCVLTYEGKRQVIRTIKPVTERDELFHSYTDICEPTIVRQSHLKSIYGFMCECQRCQGLGKWASVDAALTQEYGITEDELMVVLMRIRSAKQISADNYDDDMDNLKREYNCLQDALSIQKAKLGQYNLERYKTECLALSTSMLLGVKERVGHAEAAVKFLAFVCNQHHPLLLLQKMTLGELYLAHDMKSQARDIFEELVKSCSIVWGESHDYVQHYVVFLSQVR